MPSFATARTRACDKIIEKNRRKCRPIHNQCIDKLLSPIRAKSVVRRRGVPCCAPPPSHDCSWYGGHEQSETSLGELNQAKQLATLGLWCGVPKQHTEVHTTYTGTSRGAHAKGVRGCLLVRLRALGRPPDHICSHRWGGAGDSKRPVHRYGHSTTPTEPTGWSLSKPTWDRKHGPHRLVTHWEEGKCIMPF